MKDYKAIILGPQCSGKTTFKKYLEANHDLPLIEEDELFTELNGGKYPKDMEHKEQVLRPMLEKRIRESDNLIFLTSYCNPALLMDLKSKGFKVIQLVLEMDEFQRRNEKRMREQGYSDAGVWAKDIFDFHQKARDEGWVDLEINATLPVEVVAEKVLDFLI